VDGIGAIARAERLDRAYVTRVICLAFLAPEITRAILEGRHPTEMTAKKLIPSALRTPLLWTDQAFRPHAERVLPGCEVVESPLTPAPVEDV
jgi:hypothetical protein